jgi:hypothetical protein
MDEPSSIPWSSTVCLFVIPPWFAVESTQPSVQWNLNTLVELSYFRTWTPVGKICLTKPMVAATIGLVRLNTSKGKEHPTDILSQCHLFWI